jgi:hypothetical protein
VTVRLHAHAALSLAKEPSIPIERGLVELLNASGRREKGKFLILTGLEIHPSYQPLGSSYVTWCTLESLAITDPFRVLQITILPILIFQDFLKTLLTCSYTLWKRKYSSPFRISAGLSIALFIQKPKYLQICVVNTNR